MQPTYASTPAYPSSFQGCPPPPPPPLEHGGASQDPRSYPGLSRRRAADQGPAYGRGLAVRTSSGNSPTTVKSESLASPLYDCWEIEDHAPSHTAYAVPAGEIASSHYYYQPRSPKHESRRASGSPNYSYSRQPHRTSAHSEGYIYGESASQYTTDGAHSHHVTRRSLSDQPDWFTSPPSEASAAAAQKAVDELFPELGGGKIAYASQPDPDYALYSRAGPSNYYSSTGPYRGCSTLETASGAHSYSSGEHRPRRGYDPEYSPSRASLTSPIPDNVNNMVGYDEPYVDGSYEFADTDIDEDGDSDDESNVSAIVIKDTGCHPHHYRQGTSLSPSLYSVDSPGPETPHSVKYSSPEIIPAMSTTQSVATRQPHGGRSQMAMASGSGQLSVTSAGPKRMRRSPIANPAAAAAITQENYDDNDVLLVQYRQMGVSYKAIKALLGLEEAESTLRGRYRTLTKPKNERLRKPVWSDEDVNLLLDIVDPRQPHIKWKQVSDTIVDRGGSYRFGSSTCKKQYLNLVGLGRAQGLNENASASKRRKSRTSPIARPQKR